MDNLNWFFDFFSRCSLPLSQRTLDFSSSVLYNKIAVLLSSIERDNQTLNYTTKPSDDHRRITYDKNAMARPTTQQNTGAADLTMYMDSSHNV